MARKPRNVAPPNYSDAQKAEAMAAAARGVARDRYSSDLNYRVLRLIQELEREVVAKLSAFDPADTAARAERLRKLKREVSDEIKARYDRIAKEATGELPELAKDEARWKSASLQKTFNATGVTADVALAPTSVLEALTNQPVVLGGIAADYWAAEGRIMSANFARQMQLGVAGGESISDLIGRVRGTRAEGFKDGIMAVSRRNAESLVRTSVNSIANAAQMEVYKQNADVVEGVQHYSILDSRTTLICSGRHGLRWKLGEGYDPVGHNQTFSAPPLHWRCRSIIVSVLDMETEPAGVTFDDFFKGLSKQKQDDLFGPGRAELFRAGRISQTDLLATSGRPLTLTDLIKQNGGAPGVATPPTPKPSPTPRAETPGVSRTPIEAALAASNAEAREWVVERGLKTGVEHLVAIDENTGEIIDRNKGKKASVSFTPKMIAAMNDPSRRLVFHHNHPRSSSLSGPDVGAAHYPGFKGGIWAHAHNGSSFFSKPIDGSTALPRTVAGQWSTANNQVNGRLQSLIRAGTINYDQADRMSAHVTMLVMVERKQLQYEYTLAGQSADVMKQFKSEIAAIVEGLT